MLRSLLMVPAEVLARSSAIFADQSDHDAVDFEAFLRSDWFLHIRRFLVAAGNPACPWGLERVFAVDDSDNLVTKAGCLTFFHNGNVAVMDAGFDHRLAANLDQNGGGRTRNQVFVDAKNALLAVESAKVAWG